MTEDEIRAYAAGGGASPRWPATRDALRNLLAILDAERARHDADTRVLERSVARAEEERDDFGRLAKETLAAYTRDAAGIEDARRAQRFSDEERDAAVAARVEAERERDEARETAEIHRTDAVRLHDERDEARADLSVAIAGQDARCKTLERERDEALRLAAAERERHDADTRVLERSVARAEEERDDFARLAKETLAAYTRDAAGIEDARRAQRFSDEERDAAVAARVEAERERDEARKCVDEANADFGVLLGKKTRAVAERDAMDARCDRAERERDEARAALTALREAVEARDSCGEECRVMTPYRGCTCGDVEMRAALAATASTPRPRKAY